MVEPGAVLGEKYRVGRIIGKGGMGVVVEATHLQLGTHVAIKILTQDHAHPENIDRFLREARAAAQLRGEHLCRVHDVGTLPEGTPYMVMELLHGQDLQSVLQHGGPIEPGLVASYLLQVCTAIAEAHAAGIVHRDLKPSNLFLAECPDSTPMIKVLDFGIAKSIADADLALTHTTSVMGSPAYMSPEQLKSSRNVGPRGDIWSLGVVMYELLAGRHPFTGETLTELAININNEPAPPLPANLPADLAKVVMTCLAKLPHMRYKNVEALATALEPFASAEPSSSGAVARVLTGKRALIDGGATSPALPSNLARPSSGARTAEPSATEATDATDDASIDDAGTASGTSTSGAPPDVEIRTLQAASGAVAARAAKPRLTLRLPVLAAGVGAAILIAVVALGRHDENQHARARPAPTIAPSAAPAASSTRSQDAAPAANAPVTAPAPGAPVTATPEQQPDAAHPKQPGGPSSGSAGSSAPPIDPALPRRNIAQPPTTKKRTTKKRDRAKGRKPEVDLTESRY